MRAFPAFCAQCHYYEDMLVYDNAGVPKGIKKDCGFQEHHPGQDIRGLLPIRYNTGARTYRCWLSGMKEDMQEIKKRRVGQNAKDKKR
jgi:hypothetical protein